MQLAWGKMKTSPEETLQQYSINHLGHGDEWWISSFLLTVLHMLDSHPLKETVLEKLVVKPPTGAKTKFDTEVLYCVCHHYRSVSRPFNDPLQTPTISRLEISADPSAWPEGEAQGKHEASIRCSSDSTASLASLCIFLACLGQPVMFLACLRGASHSGCAMLSMAVSTVLFRQLNPQCCSGPLYFNPSTHYVNPSTHPRPKLPPPPTHPSLCF